MQKIQAGQRRPRHQNNPVRDVNGHPNSRREIRLRRKNGKHGVPRPVRRQPRHTAERLPPQDGFGPAAVVGGWLGEERDLRVVLNNQWPPAAEQIPGRLPSSGVPLRAGQQQFPGQLKSWSVGHHESHHLPVVHHFICKTVSHAHPHHPESSALLRRRRRRAGHRIQILALRGLPRVPVKKINRQPPPVLLAQLQRIPKMEVPGLGHRGGAD
mmetsp:Transcript_30355/g.78430  ORF Transcript_30355/g.78430 Transcript_30355/m.78430 type:complete len:212 (-) Transcript_30355:101-736(-)